MSVEDNFRKKKKMTVKRSKGAIMKRKNFNFDVMQSKASEGIKLTHAQNEYALNCYDIIFGSHSKDEDSEKDKNEFSFDDEADTTDDDDELDSDSKVKGALWTFLLSLGVTLVGIFLLVM